MNIYRFGVLPAVLLFGSIGLSSHNAAAETTLRSPDCIEIQKWIRTIDLANEYQPDDRIPLKLPAAYEDEAFAELFGKPVLEWTRAELNEMNDHLLECVKNEDGDSYQKVRPLRDKLPRILIMQQIPITGAN